MSLSASGGVAIQARSLSKRARLQGRGFRLECVAAGCLLVALRSHGREVTLPALARKLGISPSEGGEEAESAINRVVKHLVKDCGVTVAGKMAE